MLKEKKLLYLIKTMDLGGAEKFTLNLALYFKDHLKSVCIASSGGLFEEVLKKNKISHYKIKEDLKISNLLPLSRELNKFIKEENFDIIHTQHRLLQFALQIIPGKYFKNIYTSHNIFNDVYQKMLFSDIAVAISPLVKNNLIETTLLNRNKIMLINNGVELSKNLNSQRMKDQIRFGFAGRFIEEKGIFLLLKASSRLKKEGYLFSVAFRGTGDDKKLKDMIKEYNLSDLIRILPFGILNEDIYTDFDVFILPTMLNEGLPLSILEASSQGKLIITTNAGAITDFIEDNFTGILLNSVTEKEVYEKMKAVIMGEIDIDRITANALQRLQTQFSLQETTAKYKELYSCLFT